MNTPSDKQPGTEAQIPLVPGRVVILLFISVAMPIAAGSVLFLLALSAPAATGLAMAAAELAGVLAGGWALIEAIHKRLKRTWIVLGVLGVLCVTIGGTAGPLAPSWG